MRQPNLTTATSDEIVAYLRFKIREIFGDEIENDSIIYGIRGGWYRVHILALPDWKNTKGFRRTSVPYIVSRMRKLRRELDGK